MEKKIRSSGVELLRIIAMLQIVFLHVYAYSGYETISKQLPAMHEDIARLIWGFCRMPVNIFIMISGYFMVNSVLNIKHNYKRISKLYPTVIFYSLVIAIIFWISNPALFHTLKSAQAFLPVLSRSWYFISLYIIVVALSPFINIVLTNITKKQFLLLLGICFFIFSIWPTLSYINPINKVISVKKVIDTYMGFSLYSFLFMYVIGAYIRRFGVHFEKPKFKYLLAFVVFCFANFALDKLSSHFHADYVSIYQNFDNPFMILAAAAIFMFFKDLHFHSKLVNFISGTTLGIYMIHEDPFIRTWLWPLFGADHKSFYSRPTYFIKLFVIVIFVFVACATVEAVRQQLFRGVGHVVALVRGKKDLTT